MVISTGVEMAAGTFGSSPPPLTSTVRVSSLNSALTTLIERLPMASQSEPTRSATPVSAAALSPRAMCVGSTSVW